MNLENRPLFIAENLDIVRCGQFDKRESLTGVSNQ